MFRINGLPTGAYCDGLSRRSFVQLGVAGMATASLADVCRAKSGSSGRRTAAILIWLDGGPGHMDMYDMKPEAPAEYRGIWSPIRTNVPGMEVTELFPRQAKVADKFSIVRSLHHDTGDHFAGGHRMLTTKHMGVSGANNAGKFPSLGSIVAQQRGPNRRGMPSYVSVPVASSIGLRPGYFGGNWLGAHYDPFQTGGDPNSKNFKVQNLNLATGMTIDRLNDRRSLMKQLDHVSRSLDANRQFQTRDRFDEDAFEFVSGTQARKAFDMSLEDDKLRDRYGRHNWGQSTLLARRLVEAGATFVTVHYGGWDHHWNLQSGMQNYLPRVDSRGGVPVRRSGSAGHVGLDAGYPLRRIQSHTEDDTGHNGKGTPGRDHWGSSMFCLLGGGGVRGGTIVGSTDAKGTRPKDRPLRPEHIHATIYKALGIDPTLHLLDHSGRPTRVLDDPTAINELL